MNSKQMKKIRKWCKASYEITPKDQLDGLTLEQYIDKAKVYWQIDPDFQKFIKTSLVEHFSN